MGIYIYIKTYYTAHFKHMPFVILNKAIKKDTSWGFPGGTVVKNTPANAGDMGSSPGLGRFHMPRSN